MVYNWKYRNYCFSSSSLRCRYSVPEIGLNLCRCALKLTVSSRKRTLPVSRPPISDQTFNPSTNGQMATESSHVGQANEDTFEVLFNRLLSVRYHHDREMSLAAQNKREANLEHVHRTLESVWRTLCVRAGLTQSNGQTYPLPRSRLLEAPFQNYYELIVNIANPPLHTPIHSEPSTRGVLPTTQHRPSRDSSFLTSERRLSRGSSFSPTSSTPQWSPSNRSSISSTQITRYTSVTSSQWVPPPLVDSGGPALPMWTAMMFVSSCELC